MQEEILKLLEKRGGVMFSREIIEEVRVSGEAKTCVRQGLKQMRKYREIGFVLVDVGNKDKLSKKFPKVKEYADKGYIRKPCYLYFIANVRNK